MKFKKELEFELVTHDDGCLNQKYYIFVGEANIDSFQLNHAEQEVNVSPRTFTAALFNIRYRSEYWDCIKAFNIKPPMTQDNVIDYLNIIIDAKNKEQNWVADWENEEQHKYQIWYDTQAKLFYKVTTCLAKQLTTLNYMSKETYLYILENFEDELSIAFGLEKEGD